MLNEGDIPIPFQLEPASYCDFSYPNSATHFTFRLRADPVSVTLINNGIFANNPCHYWFKQFLFELCNQKEEQHYYPGKQADVEFLQRQDENQKVLEAEGVVFDGHLSGAANENTEILITNLTTGTDHATTGTNINNGIKILIIKNRNYNEGYVRRLIKFGGASGGELIFYLTGPLSYTVNLSNFLKNLVSIINGLIKMSNTQMVGKQKCYLARTGSRLSVKQANNT